MITWSPGVTLEQLEREVILAAVNFYGGNRTTAANALGVSAKTIYNKLETYGIQGEATGTENSEPDAVQTKPWVYPKPSDPIDGTEQPVSVRIAKEVQEVPSRRSSGSHPRR